MVGAPPHITDEQNLSSIFSGSGADTSTSEKLLAASLTHLTTWISVNKEGDNLAIWLGEE